MRAASGVRKNCRHTSWVASASAGVSRRAGRRPARPSTVIVLGAPSRDGSGISALARQLAVVGRATRAARIMVCSRGSAPGRASACSGDQGAEYLASGMKYAVVMSRGRSRARSRRHVPPDRVEGGLNCAVVRSTRP